MTSNERSQEILIKAISLRFLLCSKNNEWTSKERCNLGIFSQGNISSGFYWTTWTARQCEDFWCGEESVRRGCLSKRCWCCTESRCCYCDGRHERVSQTTKSKTEDENQQCKVFETPHEKSHTGQQNNWKETEKKRIHNVTPLRSKLLYLLLQTQDEANAISVI